MACKLMSCLCLPPLWLCTPGRKRWALYPPERPPPGVALVDDGLETSPDDALTSLQWFMEVYPQLPPHMRPLEFVQEPGERWPPCTSSAAVLMDSTATHTASCLSWWNTTTFIPLCVVCLVCPLRVPAANFHCPTGV